MFTKAPLFLINNAIPSLQFSEAIYAIKPIKYYFMVLMFCFILAISERSLECAGLQKLF